MRDVAIVVADPGGLVCALYLSQVGLLSIVLEADTAMLKTLLWSTFHPSSLDMLKTNFGAAVPLINEYSEDSFEDVRPRCSINSVQIPCSVIIFVP